MSRRRLSPDRIGIALLMVFVVAVTIWVLTKSSPDGHRSSDQADTTVAHVHALGVNPADSTLFAATHYGLFRIDAEGVATRVSDSFQERWASRSSVPITSLAAAIQTCPEGEPVSLRYWDSSSRPTAVHRG